MAAAAGIAGVESARLHCDRRLKARSSANRGVVGCPVEFGAPARGANRRMTKRLSGLDRTHLYPVRSKTV